MKLFKLVFSTLLILSITISTTALTIVTAINRTAFNPEFIKNTLQTTSSYTLIFNQIPAIISIFLPGNMSGRSTGISRFIINNVSKEAFKSQSDVFIDDFFSYLDGYKNTPSVDLAPLKGEIKSLSNSKQFKDLAQNKNPLESYLDNMPDNLRLSVITDSQELLLFAQTYYIFKSAPVFLTSVIITFTFILLFVNKNNLRKFFLFASISLLTSGSILGLVFLTKKYIFNSMLKYLFDNAGSEFKMLSVSLHPIALFTLSSISTFIRNCSVIIGLSGLLMIILIQTWRLKREKQTEPSRTQLTLKIINNKQYYGNIQVGK